MYASCALWRAIDRCACRWTCEGVVSIGAMASVTKVAVAANYYSRIGMMRCV